MTKDDYEKVRADERYTKKVEFDTLRSHGFEGTKTLTINNITMKRTFNLNSSQKRMQVFNPSNGNSYWVPWGFDYKYYNLIQAETELDFQAQNLLTLNN